MLIKLMNVQCLPRAELHTFSTSLWCLPWTVQLNTFQTCTQPAAARADKISRQCLSEAASGDSESIAENLWAAPGAPLAQVWRRARA